MARKDKGRKEIKRPKQDKAKKAASKLSERPPLPQPKRSLGATAAPKPRDTTGEPRSTRLWRKLTWLESMSPSMPCTQLPPMNIFEM